MTYVIIEFEAERAAKKALEACGFSLGELQRDERRGVMFGDYAISKWRNLSKQDIADLHGVYKRAFRDGPVKITFRETCPSEPLYALHDMATADA